MQLFPAPKRVPPRRRRLLAVSAAVYAGASVVAVATWWLVGDRWWTHPVNSATFWWSLPAVPLGVGAAALRRWRLAAAFAVPAAVFVWSYGALFVGRPPAPAGDFRVATYNTYIRALGVAHVAALVADEQPDVLLVQEVLPARAAELRRALGATLPHSWFGEANDVGGVGVLSRHPVVSVHHVEHRGRAARPTAVVVLDVGGRAVQVVPLHLTSPCPLCGPSLVERQTFETAARRAEVTAVLTALDPAVPAVVGGDLNSTRRSDPYRRLAAAGFRDPQVEAGSGPGFTWPAGRLPLARIDWVLARGLVPAGAHVGTGRGSNHRPVVVDFAWAETGGDGDGAGR